MNSKLSLVFCLATMFVLALTWAGCKKDDNKRDYLAEADCTVVDPIANTYTFYVKAVLDASCATGGCHDAITKSNGIDFSTYVTAKASFETQDVLCAINHGEGCEPMPKGGVKLQQVTLNALACWVENGYPQ